MVSAVVADTQSAFRQCLRDMLASHDVQVSGEASDATEVLWLVRHQAPDLLVVDSELLLADAAVLARELRMLAAPPRMIVLATIVSEQSVLAAFRAGIQALVPKGCIGMELKAALYAVVNGRGYLSPEIMEQMVKSWPLPAASVETGLSSTEQAVLQLLVQDTSTAAIADLMQLDGGIVDAWREILFRKLQCTNMGGLVRHAVRNGYCVARKPE